jgi:hypothetical protein
MYKLPAFALFLLALAISACGGGGGGSSSNGGNGGSGGTGGGGGGGTGGGGGGSPDSTAEIIFPWTTSSALTQTITVSGTASDSDGIAGVLVNGVASSLSAGSTNVTWSTQLALSSGNNDISISVQDSNGTVTDDLDTATIKYVEVPITFTLDADATRVVGQSNTRTGATIIQKLVQHNYDTGEQTVFGEVRATPSLTCFRRFEDEFLFLRGDASSSLNLYRYDLATGEEDVLSNVPAAFMDGGTGYKTGSVRDFACGDTHTSAYALVSFVRETDSWYSKSRIVEIDLAGLNFSTLAETDPAAPVPWWGLRMALDDAQIVTMQGINPDAPLTGVSLSDGTLTELTPGLNIGGLALHPELASDLVYVATFDGIDKVDLVAGTRQNLSIVSSDDPLAFAQVRDMAFDAANDRILVGDESLDTVIAIDVSTGDRSAFISRSIGSGIPLVVPRKFAISSDATHAIVFDDGGNVAERLFEVDLTTGDRRAIGDINQPFNYIASGLAYDEAGQRAFISFRHRILEVDLVTEGVSELAHVDTTVLEYIGNLMFDAANDRLLITDPSNDGIYSLDLGSSAIDVVSRNGEKGSGAAFGTLVSATESETPGELFAAGQASGVIYRVDLATGDRTALTTNCDLGGSPTFPGLMQIRYNEAANELLILDNVLYSLDLDSDQCSRLPQSNALLEVQPVSAEQLLAVTFGALWQYDRETGEVVVISK